MTIQNYITNYKNNLTYIKVSGARGEIRTHEDIVDALQVRSVWPLRYSSILFNNNLYNKVILLIFSYLVIKFHLLYIFYFFHFEEFLQILYTFIVAILITYYKFILYLVKGWGYNSTITSLKIRSFIHRNTLCPDTPYTII